MNIDLLNNMKRVRRKNFKIITSNLDSVFKKNVTKTFKKFQFCAMIKKTLEIIELAGKFIYVNCCRLNFLCVYCVLKFIFHHYITFQISPLGVELVVRDFNPRSLAITFGVVREVLFKSKYTYLTCFL